MSFSWIDVCIHTSPSTRLAQFILILMAIAAVSIALERWSLYRRLPGAHIVLEAGRQARAAGAGRAEQHRAMERAAREYRHALGDGLRTLLTVSFLALAVGLLATLVGVTNTCRGMALTGSESFGALALGLSDALVPLGWAIAVGLVSFWSYALLDRRRDGIVREMAKAVLD